MTVYAIRTDGVPSSRPRAFGPGVSYSPGAYAPVPPQTSGEAYGGTMRTLGHPGSLALVGDPSMANYLPPSQQPSRWAPPVAGNQLRPVITTPAAFMPHTPNTQPEHIPVPATPANSNVAKLQQQLDQRREAFKGGPKAIATPTPTPRPRFRLYGGGTT